MDESSVIRHVPSKEVGVFINYSSCFNNATVLFKFTFRYEVHLFNILNVITLGMRLIMENFSMCFMLHTIFGRLTKFQSLLENKRMKIDSNEYWCQCQWKFNQLSDCQDSWNERRWVTNFVQSNDETVFNSSLAVFLDHFVLEWDRKGQWDL